MTAFEFIDEDRRKDAAVIFERAMMAIDDLKRVPGSGALMLILTTETLSFDMRKRPFTQSPFSDRVVRLVRRMRSDAEVARRYLRLF